MDDVQLNQMYRNLINVEREIRQQLNEARESASEQLRGQQAFRHAIALRRALESWIDTRKYRAAHPED